MRRSCWRGRISARSFSGGAGESRSTLPRPKKETAEMAVTEVLIPAGEGRAFRVPIGALLEIVDVEGQQVADFISIIEDQPHEWLSATHTRSSLLRLNLKVG